MRSGRQGALVVAALLGCGAGAAARAAGSNSWTNVAGHVLEAAPQAIKGETVTFKQEGTGQTVDYPLSVFPLGEQERLQVLQSPQGADKTPVDISDTAQIVRLYERVLPYAVLFGLEKEWAKVLEVHYGETGASPSWYHGTSAFNAAMLGSAISGFSSSAVSSFAPPSSSSGSGFSSGGGFSGGGFGGGGGGGR